MLVQKLGLRAKIFLVSIVSITLLAVVGSITIVNLDELDHSNQWINHTYKVMQVADKLKIAVVGMDAASKEFVFTRNEDLRDVYKQYETTADSISGKLAKTVSDNPAQSSLMLQIKSDIESWNKQVGSKRFEKLEAKVVTTEVETSSRRSRKSKLVKKTTVKTPTNQEIAKNFDSDEVYLNRIASQVDRFKENEMLLVKVRTDNSKRITENTNLAITIGLILSIVIATIISLLVSSSIMKPFQDMFKGLRKFSNEELYSLNREFKKLVSDMTSVSGKLSTASSKIFSASDTLSKNVTEQASSVEQTSASMEEISGMTENNVMESKNLQEIAVQMQEQMQELGGAMDEITESNNKIEHLSEIINEIAEKTAIIDDIVFQTKLLSFNASVEAERAGEHGRGFAVVAQEVGNLAQMSGKAALEIAELVRDSTSKAVSVAKENKSRVEQGSKIVNATQKQAKSISEGAVALYNASNEQSVGITEVNTAIGIINKTTIESSAISDENSRAGNDLLEQADSLNSFVEKLNSFLQGIEEKTSYASTVGEANIDVRNSSPAILHEPSVEVKPNDAHVKQTVVSNNQQAEHSLHSGNNVINMRSATGQVQKKVSSTSEHNDLEELTGEDSSAKWETL